MSIELSQARISVVEILKPVKEGLVVVDIDGAN
jgi:hypothetical protein